MVNYSNETKVKDIPLPSLEVEIKELLKAALFDFGSDMTKDAFQHSYVKIAYLVSNRYKSLKFGEVKYIFEMAPEQIKGKLSVQTMMQLFYRYNDAKIEKQKQEFEKFQFENFKNAVDCSTMPLGKAIVYKYEVHEKTRKYPEMPIKEIAERIATGEIKFNYTPGKRKRVIFIEQ